MALLAFDIVGIWEEEIFNNFILIKLLCESLFVRAKKKDLSRRREQKFGSVGVLNEGEPSEQQQNGQK